MVKYTLEFIILENWIYERKIVTDYIRETCKSGLLVWVHAFLVQRLLCMLGKGANDNIKKGWTVIEKWMSSFGARARNRSI